MREVFCSRHYICGEVSHVVLYLGVLCACGRAHFSRDHVRSGATGSAGRDSRDGQRKDGDYRHGCFHQLTERRSPAARRCRREAGSRPATPNFPGSGHSPSARHIAATRSATRVHDGVDYGSEMSCLGRIWRRLRRSPCMAAGSIVNALVLGAAGVAAPTGTVTFSEGRGRAGHAAAGRRWPGRAGHAAQRRRAHDCRGVQRRRELHAFGGHQDVAS